MGITFSCAVPLHSQEEYSTRKKKVMKHPEQPALLSSDVCIFVEERLSTFFTLNFLHEDEVDQAARKYVILPLGGVPSPPCPVCQFWGFPTTVGWVHSLDAFLKSRCSAWNLHWNNYESFYIFFSFLFSIPLEQRTEIKIPYFYLCLSLSRVFEQSWRIFYQDPCLSQ